MGLQYVPRYNQNGGKRCTGKGKSVALVCCAGKRASLDDLIVKGSLSILPGLTTRPGYVTTVRQNSHFDNSNKAVALVKIRRLSAT